MAPRLILRTHYQVDEPAILKWLVRDFTSPTQSDFADRVAGRLAQAMKKAGKKFNHSAGRYAVDFARALRLLRENLVWTELGHLLAVVVRASDFAIDLSLSLEERLLFFRLFLEADGAALLFIARLVNDKGELPPEGQTWNDVANAMVIETCSDYMGLITDIATRINLRRIVDQRRARPFSGKSGAHQMFVHLQAMYRLGILSRADHGNSRRYVSSGLSTDEPTAVERLVRAVPDVDSLERILKNQQWPVVAQDVFRDQLPSLGATAPELAPEDIFRRLQIVYHKVDATGVALCPVKTLIENLQIDQLARGDRVTGFADAMTALEELRREYPRDIRFHVDRVGRPAFIKLSDHLDI